MLARDLAIACLIAVFNPTFADAQEASPAVLMVTAFMGECLGDQFALAQTNDLYADAETRPLPQDVLQRFYSPLPQAYLSGSLIWTRENETSYFIVFAEQYDHDGVITDRWCSVQFINIPAEEVTQLLQGLQQSTFVTRDLLGPHQFNEVWIFEGTSNRMIIYQFFDLGAGQTKLRLTSMALD